MLRICKKRGDRRIGLAGAKFEVCVLGIPTGERRVMLSYSLIGISSCRTRRVRVQTILKDFEIHLLKPWLEKSRLPKPRQMIGRVGAIQVLNHGILGIGGIRAKPGGWPRRNSEALPSTQGFQAPASGVTGFGLDQTPGIGG